MQIIKYFQISQNDKHRTIIHIKIQQTKILVPVNPKTIHRTVIIAQIEQPSTDKHLTPIDFPLNLGFDPRLNSSINLNLGPTPQMLENSRWCACLVYPC